MSGSDSVVVDALADGDVLEDVAARFGLSVRATRMMGYRAGIRPVTRTQVDLAARNAAIVADRDAGWTLQEIGDRHGVTRERARQVLKKAGSVPRFALSPRQRILRAEADSDAEALSAWFAGNGPATLDVVLEAVGLDHDRWRRAVATGNVPAHMALRQSKPKGSTSFEEAVDAVRRARAKQLRLDRRPPAHLSGKRYDELRESGDPSSMLIVARWSWRSVCEELGLPLGGAKGRRYRKTWTDEQMLRWVAAWRREQLESCGSLTARSYDEWARTRAGAPSGALVRMRFCVGGRAPWSELVTGLAI